jgi:hypothetical protein
MVAGFVHGVLNSDNIAITGESFDYGPWRFAPTWDESFTAAYFDHAGLYAFGRQAEAIQWDLAQLAMALAGLAEEEPLVNAYHDFPKLFRARFEKRVLWRLGLTTDDAVLARDVAGSLIGAMSGEGRAIDRVFFDWRGGRGTGEYAGSGWDALRTLAPLCRVLPGATDHHYWQSGEPCSMLIDEVEAIWAAIDREDDWTPLTAKVAAIRAMGDAHGPAPHG